LENVFALAQSPSQALGAVRDSKPWLPYFSKSSFASLRFTTMFSWVSIIVNGCPHELFNDFSMVCLTWATSAGVVGLF
jgi:hypothetical protein